MRRLDPRDNRTQKSSAWTPQRYAGPFPLPGSALVFGQGVSRPAWVHISTLARPAPANADSFQNPRGSGPPGPPSSGLHSHPDSGSAPTLPLQDRIVSAFGSDIDRCPRTALGSGLHPTLGQPARSQEESEARALKAPGLSLPSTLLGAVAVGGGAQKKPENTFLGPRMRQESRLQTGLQVYLNRSRFCPSRKYEEEAAPTVITGTS